MNVGGSPPPRRPTVALLTDFGTDDPFVGVMKAVVLARCPEANVVDVTHGILPQSIAEGAFWLARSFRWFAAGTVFVVVVDPGVGTDRDGIVLASGGRFFVGPDNGLFGGVAAMDGESTAFVIEAERLGLARPSRTFHGRDVFAPVAAELAAGRISPRDTGPRRAGVRPSPVPEPRRVGRDVEGVVVTVDRFGNAFTNIEVDGSLADAKVEVAGRRVPVVGTYADASPGDLVALENAFGVLEVARRDGDAEKTLGLSRGDRVVLRRK